MVPALVESIKELGLVLVSALSTPQSDPSRKRAQLEAVVDNLDGVLMANGILEFKSGVGMS